MIQRPQSVWLALTVLLGIVYICTQFYSWVLLALIVIASGINLYTIFLYMRRLVQARFCLLSMLVYLIWYIALIVYSKQVAPDAADFQPALVDAIPAVCIVLTFMSRKGILADERHVRECDRIR